MDFVEQFHETSGGVFDQEFMRTVVGRMDSNEGIFKRILDDDDFRETLKELYA